MQIIMIAGKKGSGKDFVADYLVKKHGYKRYAFADIMKQILAVTFDINMEELEVLKNDVNMRTWLQRFGTEAMKPVFGNDIWARLLGDKILNSDNDKIVISDFRFVEEYEHISKKFTCKVESWHIGSYNIDNDTHSSENALGKFEFDRYFFNNKNNDDILKEVDKCIRS